MRRIGIDVGGTFTDFCFQSSRGPGMIHKTLSTPSDPSASVLSGLAEIAEQVREDPQEFLATIDLIVHGTTVTTNAVLTRSGASCALLTTRGLRDALQMRGGTRPEPFNNWYVAPPPLVPRWLRLGLRGRRDVVGAVIEPLDAEDLDRALNILAHENVESVAICFMHSHASPDDERSAAAMARKALPHAYVTSSSDLVPQLGFNGRLQTVVLNAYVGPILRKHIERLEQRLSESGFAGPLLIMQSNGGIATPKEAIQRAAVTVLSGPAAAPVAAVRFCSEQGIDQCIVVDMGGTSFDVAVVEEGFPALSTEGSIGEYEVALPMLDIHTIGAGGGSIGRVDDGGLLRVGPESAGADPGPACYGRGGEWPTCTDADLVLGYLDPDLFARSAFKLDRLAAGTAITGHVAEPLGLSTTDAAAAMYAVMTVNLAAGIREVSVRRGLDLRDFSLVVAGGAGPLHALAVAEELEILDVLIPPTSSVLSAQGMLLSDFSIDLVTSFHHVLDEFFDMSLLNEAMKKSLNKGVARLRAQGVAESRVRVDFSLDMRYAGQFFDVNVPLDPALMREGLTEPLLKAFHEVHDQLFGYSLAESRCLTLNLRARVVGQTNPPPLEASVGVRPLEFLGHRIAFNSTTGSFEDFPVWNGNGARAAERVEGPALIESVGTTILVRAGWSGEIDRVGSWHMRFHGECPSS